MVFKAWFFTLFFIFPIFAQEIQVIDMKYLVDMNNSYTPETFYTHKEKLESSKPIKSFGYTDATIWIYYKVKNTHKENADNLLHFSYHLIDYIEVFEYQNGMLVDNYLTGALTPYNTRKIDSVLVVFPFSLKNNEVKEFVFKINSEGPLLVSTNLLTHQEFDHLSHKKEFSNGAYFGAVFIIIIYNLILFLIIKDRAYLYYVFFHFSYFFLQLSGQGLANKYFWPMTPEINHFTIALMPPIILFFLTKFALLFLEIPKTSKIYKRLHVMPYTIILTLFLIPFLPLSIMNKIYLPFIILVPLSLLLTAIYIFFTQRTLSSKFYIISQSVLIGGSILTIFNSINTSMANELFMHASQLGTVAEMLILSLALANRYTTMYQKVVSAESDLRDLNRNLEQKVKERTQDLAESNQKLFTENGNKSVLLRELYHRVKNNLQIISSLLSLQAKDIKDKEAKSIFDENNQRIKAMAMIHEKLFLSNDLEAVNMQNYISDLVNDLQQSFHMQTLNFNISCESFVLDLGKAAPIGLIINELITNAIKYAFEPSQEKKIITIEMKVREDNLFALEVSDNGKGVDLEKVKRGFGFKLIESLAVYQLDGKINYHNDHGLHHTILFSREMLL